MDLFSGFHLILISSLHVEDFDTRNNVTVVFVILYLQSSFTSHHMTKEFLTKNVDMETVVTAKIKQYINICYVTK